MGDVVSVLFHGNVLYGGSHFQLQVQASHGADESFVHDVAKGCGGASLEAAEADHRIFTGLQFQWVSSGNYIVVSSFWEYLYWDQRKTPEWSLHDFVAVSADISHAAEPRELNSQLCL